MEYREQSNPSKNKIVASLLQIIIQEVYIFREKRLFWLRGISLMTEPSTDLDKCILCFCVAHTFHIDCLRFKCYRWVQILKLTQTSCLVM